jgi:DNA-binding NtrC family response regulator
MVVLSRNSKISVRDIPLEIRTGAPLPEQRKRDVSLSLEDSEKDLIVKALKCSGGNRTEAAQSLGISRRTLHRKLNEYELRDVL